MRVGLRKPSPAMVVACISLFVALGGVSTAAVVVLKKNSVLSKHIKNGQVKTPDLGANAVNSAKVGDGSLLAQDFATGQLPAGQGVQGPAGPTGATGANGAAGASFTWRGAFDCDGSYAPRDVVSYQGSAWITNQAIGGCVDPPFAPWELMASKGDQGATGAAGTARAYGRVLFNVTFDGQRTSGFTSVTRPETGVYCLVPAAGISSTNRPAVTAVDWAQTSDPEGNASAMSTPNIVCASGEFEVRTERHSTVSNAVPANGVGFTIIVP